MNNKTSKARVRQLLNSISENRLPDSRRQHRRKVYNATVQRIVESDSKSWKASEIQENTTSNRYQPHPQYVYEPTLLGELRSQESPKPKVSFDNEKRATSAKTCTPTT